MTNYDAFTDAELRDAIEATEEFLRSLNDRKRLEEWTLGLMRRELYGRISHAS